MRDRAKWVCRFYRWNPQYNINPKHLNFLKVHWIMLWIMLNIQAPSLIVWILPCDFKQGSLPFGDCAAKTNPFFTAEEVPLLPPFLLRERLADWENTAVNYPWEEAERASCSAVHTDTNIKRPLGVINSTSQRLKDKVHRDGDTAIQFLNNYNVQWPHQKLKTYLYKYTYPASKCPVYKKCCTHDRFQVKKHILPPLVSGISWQISEEERKVWL